MRGVTVFLTLIFQVYGRLANKMLGYAVMTALKLEYGFRTFMEERHLGTNHLLL